FIKNQIITIHDLICLNFPKQHKFQFLYFKYLLPILLKSSKKIIAISSFTKDEIIKFYRISPEKIEVIHNGSNKLSQKINLTTEAEINRITKGLPFFLSVGNSYGHKNTLKLLEVAKLMKDKPVVFLVLGADNLFFKKLREKAEKENLSNVIFLNYVSKELLAGFYEKCIANVYISLYEGFGFPPMEAACFNSISVVSNIPVMKEIYGDSVIYVNPNSSSDILQKLEGLFLNNIDLAIYKNKFDKLFEKYSWEKTAENTINLINKEFNLQ
ncbi:MAG: glycosyltransferase family 1 protein, partial [Capnocytophaga sp.]|nr:glycosyltransferase family 1 protein [Capnocytophaga sp.]